MTHVNLLFFCRSGVAAAAAPAAWGSERTTSQIKSRTRKWGETEFVLRLYNVAQRDAISLLGPGQ